MGSVRRSSNPLDVVFTRYARGVVPIDDEMIKNSVDGAARVVWLVERVVGNCRSARGALHTMWGSAANAFWSVRAVFTRVVFGARLVPMRFHTNNLSLRRHYA